MPLQITKINSLVTFILLATSVLVCADDLIQSGVDATLTIPKGWTARAERASMFIYPPVNAAKGEPQRRIHLAPSRHQAGTLEDAMNADMDAIAERSPEWGSWNDRNHLLGTRVVVTRSGMEGLAAEFGWKIEGRRKFSINKFYFRDAAGTIFVVCAHVYGGEDTGADFEKIVREGLTPREADKAKPADTSPHSNEFIGGRS